MISYEQADTMADIQPTRLNTSPTPVKASVDVGGLTHAGMVRQSNEDNFHVVRFGRHLRTVVSSLPPSQCPEEVNRAGYAFAVADGMGGHAAGEVASRLAITLLVQHALDTPDWILGGGDDLMGKAMSRAAERFEAVNAAVVAEALSKEATAGMGTTLSLAMSLGDDLIVAHVGDSPVCLFRHWSLIRLTRDHTAEADWKGTDPVLSARLRHILTRAIGVVDGGAEPDVERYRLADGDRLLLCTDGLTNMVSDEEIARELGRGTSSTQACQALVDLALERGASDNVTVVVATYRFAGSA